MKRIIRFSLALLMAFQVTACKQGIVDTKSLDGDFRTLLEVYRLESDDQVFESSKMNYALLRKLSDAKNKYLSAIRKTPKLKGQLKNDKTAAEQWIDVNKDKLTAWNAEIEDAGLGLRKSIIDSSRAAFELQELQPKIRAQITSLYALLYYREGNKALINFMTPFMLALGSDNFKGSEKIEAFKKQVTDIAFAQVGLSVIIKQDLQKVTAGLTETRKSVSELDSDIQEAVNHTMKSLVAAATETDKSIRSLETKLNAEQQEQMSTMKAQIAEIFANKTLLYVPGANNNVAVDLLVWIGNLTWGLVNTMIGLGIILTAAIVSPFTEYVDFPTFDMSLNGKQIYVDVTGMSPVPGKMSMGIFELDNAAGPEFATGHEGAHGIQSALLGPLYIPVVLLSYAIAGFDQGFMEQWADEWQDI